MDKTRAKSITLLRLSSEGRLELKIFAFRDNMISAQHGDAIVPDKAGSSKFFGTLGTVLNPLTPLLLVK
jgi:hypothetical protein